MSERTKGSEPNLFDLPLQPPPVAEGHDRPPAAEERPRRARPARPPRHEEEVEDEGLPLFPEGGAPAAAAAGDHGPPPAGHEGELDEEAWPFAARADEAEGDVSGHVLADDDVDDLADPTAVPPRPRPVPAPVPSDDRHEAGEPDPLRRKAPAPATPLLRLRAILVDAGIHLVAASLGAAAALALGVPLGLADVYPFALFLVVFSFLYTVVTLAFWGQTPGMAAAGLTARSAGDQPLSFGQTGLRWLAGLVTVATLGLPLLFLLTRRSLADRMSGTEMLERG